MKKLIIGAIAIVCLVVWCVRYYTLNGTFAVHELYPQEVYSMHETVYFNDYKSYNMYDSPNYSISLEAARIIDSDDYLTEIDKNKEDFHYLSERYLELTFTISNYGDDMEGVNFYGIPVIGTNWYAFYDNEITACINPFFKDNYDAAAFGCAVNKDSSATVKVAYNLYENMFLEKQWDNLEQEKMQLWITLRPIDQRITISL